MVRLLPVRQCLPAKPEAWQRWGGINFSDAPQMQYSSLSNEAPSAANRRQPPHHASALAVIKLPDPPGSQTRFPRRQSTLSRNRQTPRVSPGLSENLLRIKVSRCTVVSIWCQPCVQSSGSDHISPIFRVAIERNRRI
jgi:hypothetical protein